MIKLTGGRWSDLLGMLYVPNNGIRAEILFMGPNDTVMGRTDKSEIRFVGQFFESTALQIRLHIKYTRNTATGLYLDFKILKWDCF